MMINALYVANRACWVLTLYVRNQLTHWGRENGRHFADDIFKWIFVNEKYDILIPISSKFVTKGLSNSTPTLL